MAAQPGDPQRSVLILNDEWGTAKGGISTIHREISVVLAKETGVDVYSTVLEAGDVDKADAQQKGITLITPNINPLLSPEEKTPRLSWLILHKSFFPDLVNLPNVKVIIGHAPITNEIAIQIQEAFPNAKVCLFNHVIPEDIEAFKDTWTPQRVQERERKIQDSAGKATVVFSVGPRMFDHFNNKFRALKPAPLHMQYLPRPSQNFFDVQMQNLPEIKTMRVITFGRIRGVEKLKGYDLVAAALSEVARAYHDVFESAPVWVIRGIPENEHKDTKTFLDKHITHGHLDVKQYPYGSQDDIIVDLQQSHLCIMASRTEPFGLVGLEAIAAGIPTLVTKHSGLAQYLEKQFPLLAQSMVVDVGINDYSKKDDIKQWRQEIIRVLRGYNVAFKRAQDLKQELENCSAALESHERFKEIISQ
ncbi:uncharacterized protein [Ptychodera flava]|uniref:uncharacterized protein n=1 Tax=Ptychodera flava TaxID=63121 RepID=UPI00396A8F6E